MKTTLPSIRPLAGVFLAGALILGACGGDDDDVSATPGADATAADEGTVEIERSRFDPLEITVAPGGTVEFVNLDPYAHTVTSAEGSSLAYDSGSFGEGETFRQTFDDPGSFDYFCQIHPTMRATVVVE